MNAILDKLSKPDTDLLAYYVKGTTVKEVCLTTGYNNKYQTIESNKHYNRIAIAWYDRKKKNYNDDRLNILFVHPLDEYNDSYLPCSDYLYGGYNCILTLSKDDAYRYLIHQVEMKKQKLNAQIRKLQEKWNKTNE